MQHHSNSLLHRWTFCFDTFSQLECYVSVSQLLSEGDNQIRIQTCTFPYTQKNRVLIISSFFRCQAFFFFHNESAAPSWAASSEWWNAPSRAKVQRRRGEPPTLARRRSRTNTLIASFLCMQIILRRAMSRRATHCYSGREYAGRN